MFCSLQRLGKGGDEMKCSSPGKGFSGFASLPGLFFSGLLGILFGVFCAVSVLRAERMASSGCDWRMFYHDCEGEHGSLECDDARCRRDCGVPCSRTFIRQVYLCNTVWPVPPGLCCECWYWEVVCMIIDRDGKERVCYLAGSYNYHRVEGLPPCERITTGGDVIGARCRYAIPPP